VCSKRSTIPSIARITSNSRILVDYGNPHFKFPEEIVLTGKYPDITAYNSFSAKPAIVVQLTVRWGATSIATNKYYDLEMAARIQGFRSHSLLLMLMLVG